jgi:hypothetical protein
VPGLTLHPRQRLPRGWRWGASQRGDGWIGSYIVGPAGRRIVAKLDRSTAALAVDELRSTLATVTVPREVQAQQ